MSAFTEEKREHQNDADNVRLVRFPKEVTVFGNISRVYVEDKDNHEKIVFQRDQASASREYRGEKTNNYVIIPIKDKNCDIQFVKAPLYKLRRKPKTRKVEDAKCRKLNLFGEATTEEDLPKWSADRSEFCEWEEIASRHQTNGQTVFRFVQSDEKGRQASELGECTFRPLVIGPKEEGKTEEGKMEEGPPRKMSKAEGSREKDYPRLLQYLITLKGRKLKKRFPSE